MKINLKFTKIFIYRITTITVTMAMATLWFRDTMLHEYNTDFSGLVLLFFMIVAIFPSLVTIFWKNEKKKEGNFLILATCGYVIFVFREYLLIIIPVLLVFLLFYMMILFLVKTDRIVKIIKWAIYLETILAGITIVLEYINFISGIDLLLKNSPFTVPTILVHVLDGENLLLVSFFIPFFIFDFICTENKKWVKFMFIISLAFIANFLLSNYGNYIVEKKLDPCYEFVGGKNASWYVKGNRVCREDGYYTKTYKEADAKTFKKFAEGYSQYYGDKNHIYYRNDIIPEADPKTFQVFNVDGGYAYAKDANNVFYEGEIWEDIDAKTFEVVNSYYAKTDNKVFYEGEEIQGADATTFKIIYYELAKDKSAIYYNGKRYSDIDPKKFRSIGQNYYKDDKRIYLHADIVENADPKTFRPIGPSCGTDGEKYFRGKEMVEESCMIKDDVNRMDNEMKSRSIEIPKKKCFLGFCL